MQPPPKKNPMHSLFPGATITWTSFVLRVVVPTALTVILFLGAIFFLLLPMIEKNSMDRKREMIRELTTSAWNILAKLENDERLGLLTREQAQQMAIEQIRNLHYGQEMKDYFWINDMHPRVVIHPYRTDLNGQDVSGFTDPDGKKVFVEIVRLVEQHGKGYLHYKWQSRGNKYHIVPKISFVKGFAPWGWIIGTGVYIEDIKAEISIIINRVITFSLVILLLIALLMGSIISISYKTHLQQQKAEDELKKTQSSLLIAEKMASLGKLSAMVAHEINNPLFGILSYARLSSRYLDQGNVTPEHLEVLKKNLSIIASEAKRCGDIAKNLLSFAKRTLGDMKVVRLSDIIDVSTKVMEHTAKMKDIALVTEIGDGDDLSRCDAGAIQQIIVSMLANAIEASAPGSTIRVCADYRDRDSVTLRIIDTGEGIPEEIIPKIFEPFFSTKESNKSLGLGLAAVYGIVQRHGGTITVRSQVGEGTECIVTLPRGETRSPEKEREGVA
jgi:signal transduction histidine kinase